MTLRRVGSVVLAVGAVLLLLAIVPASAMPLATPLGVAHLRIPQADTGTFRVVAAGDIACDPSNALFNRGRGVGGWCRAEATAKLIERLDPDTVLALGDEQYDVGRLAAFRASYAHTWGRHKARTLAVPGNHEYYSGGRARGFFTYFGRHAGPDERGWYTKQLGTWRLIALNSNCTVVACGRQSVQYAWLAKTLADKPATCTVAMMHHPLVSSGPHGDDESGALPLWKLLYQGGVDVALTSHDHIYERFAPIDASGARDVTTGIREFVVGTGGAEHYPIEGGVHASSQRHNTKTFGVLELSLSASGYSWRFRHIGGSTFTDEGSGSCHDAPA